ncbi:hypothetical protein BDP27DRAFT_1336445 [Rhodocollybia butyracea]|uniref:Uncharacterized protein n=1 Tax=Rhodocollybia butyracea TaxID=206335 RepID=A0A9P5U1K8_9AGAR|nr:hypothetical protein BDP27DRAFT_1336445 [Rhodocollybia butyracea]
MASAKSLQAFCELWLTVISFPTRLLPAIPKVRHLSQTLFNKTINEAHSHVHGVFIFSFVDVYSSAEDNSQPCLIPISLAVIIVVRCFGRTPESTHHNIIFGRFMLMC